MLTLFALLCMPLASATDLSPDRPGVGESTATPGDGGVVVEGGLGGQFFSAFGVSSSAFGLMGTRARYGIGDSLEARVVVPDLVVNDPGGFTAGVVGVGGKGAFLVTDALAVSAVPELGWDLSGDAFWGILSLNATCALDPASVWINLTPTVYGSGAEVSVGGGASYAVGPGGAFVNGALYSGGGGGLLGFGGWYGMSETLQLDAGLDVWMISGLELWMPTVGASAAF